MQASNEWLFGANHSAINAFIIVNKKSKYGQFLELIPDDYFFSKTPTEKY